MNRTDKREYLRRLKARDDKRKAEDAARSAQLVELLGKLDVDRKTWQENGYTWRSPSPARKHRSTDPISGRVVLTISVREDIHQKLDELCVSLPDDLPNSRALVVSYLILEAQKINPQDFMSRLKTVDLRGRRRWCETHEKNEKGVTA